jgi:hypothetical protein
VRTHLPRVLAALLVLSPVGATAVGERCQGEVNAYLVKLGVEPSDITRVHYRAKRSGGVSSSSSKGATARVSLRSCAGTVVVDVASTCRVEQVHTRGACSVEGLKAY